MGKDSGCGEYDLKIMLLANTSSKPSGTQRKFAPNGLYERANRSHYNLFTSQSAGPRAFHFYLESMERLSVFVFAAKHMVKGAATLTSFALGFVEIHAEFITAAAR